MILSDRRPIGIAAIRSFLPAEIVSNSAAIVAHGFDETFVYEKLGIRERRAAGHEEYVSDLAAAAGQRLLEDTGTDARNIGLLVVVTQTPDYCLPHVSAVVADRLGCAPSTAAFDISLGCSGYVYGLQVVSSMMKAQGIDKGLLITAETYSKLVSPADRATAPLFGDGAAATLLSADAVYDLGKFSFGTDGSRHEALIARGSAVRRDRVEPLFMDGREIFAFVIGSLPRSIEACLALNDLTRDDIDSWIFHQASRHMVLSLAARLRIPQERCVIDVERIGNTTSSTIPIALETHALETAKRPQRIFLSGFGVGLSWGNTVLTLRTENSK